MAGRQGAVIHQPYPLRQVCVTGMAGAAPYPAALIALTHEPWAAAGSAAEAVRHAAPRLCSLLKDFPRACPSA